MKCPECNSTTLKRVTWFRDDDGWYETGLWHDYKDERPEPGHYVCDCGYEFFVGVEELMANEIH